MMQGSHGPAKAAARGRGPRPETPAGPLAAPQGPFRQRYYGSTSLSHGDSDTVPRPVSDSSLTVAMTAPAARCHWH